MKEIKPEHEAYEEIVSQLENYSRPRVKPLVSDHSLWTADEYQIPSFHDIHLKYMSEQSKTAKDWYSSTQVSTAAKS